MKYFTQAITPSMKRTHEDLKRTHERQLKAGMLSKEDIKEFDDYVADFERNIEMDEWSEKWFLPSLAIITAISIALILIGSFILG